MASRFILKSFDPAPLFKCLGSIAPFPEGWPRLWGQWRVPWCGAERYDSSWLHAGHY